MGFKLKAALLKRGNKKRLSEKDKKELKEEQSSHKRALSKRGANSSEFGDGLMSHKGRPRKKGKSSEL